MSALPILSHSRTKVARSCAREEQLRYVEGWRAKADVEVLRFGTLVHRGLELWWKTGQLEDALAALQGESDAYMRVRAEALMIAYATRWSDDRELYEVIAVEVEFRAPLVNPDSGAPSQTFQLGGKIDVLVRERATGDYLVVEHKTTSEDLGDGGTYWKRLLMDGQISIYQEGATRLGYKPRACLWDVLAVPALRPLKATPPESRKFTKEGRLYATQREVDETPEEYRNRLVEKLAESPNDYLQRREIPRLERELEEAARDRWQIAQQLRDGHRLGRAPRNPDACLRFSRACDFFDVCSGGASLDDPSRFKRLSFPHPELTQTPEAK